MRFVFLATTLLVAAAAVTPARAQVDSREGIALQNQIYQLRQQLQALQDQRGGGGGGYPASRPPSYQPQPQQGGNDLLAQLLTRVDTLEDQVRQLRGRIDELQNQQQQMGQELNKKIDDLAFQATQQPGQPSPPPSAPQPREPQQQQQRPSGPRTPEVALQDGHAALARRDYPAAEAAAREVLSNRTSPRAYDAKLLLAQALQGEKQYPQAAVAFDDAYNMSRKGSHAQDALLGLANSLAAIKESKAACDTLGRLRADFPQLRPEIKDGMAVTAQKASCR